MQRFGAAGLRGFATITYPSIPETMSIDTDVAAEAIRVEKPRICYFGQSVFLFPSDLQPMIEAAREVGASVMYDAAHVLGLIAGGRFQDPLGGIAKRYDVTQEGPLQSFPRCAF